MIGMGALLLGGFLTKQLPVGSRPGQGIPGGPPMRGSPRKPTGAIRNGSEAEERL